MTLMKDEHWLCSKACLSTGLWGLGTDWIGWAHCWNAKNISMLLVEMPLYYVVKYCAWVFLDVFCYVLVSNQKDSLFPYEHTCSLGSSSRILLHLRCSEWLHRARPFQWWHLNMLPFMGGLSVSSIHGAQTIKNCYLNGTLRQMLQS